MMGLFLRFLLSSERSELDHPKTQAEGGFVLQNLYGVS